MRVLAVTQESGHIRIYLKKRKREEVLKFLEETNSNVEKAKLCLAEMIKHNSVNEYEEEWDRLRKSYDVIQIFFLSVEALGEFVPRYLIIKNEKKGEDEKKTLKVYIPESGSNNRVCNDYLLEYVSRDINLVKQEELPFWLFVFQNHAEELTVDDINRYSGRGSFPVYLKEAYKQRKLFSQTEEERGHDKQSLLQIAKRYVCLGARTATYNQLTLGHDFDYDHRNMKFEDYRLAIEYLNNMSIQTVKMGRMENRMEPVNNCIDYAGEGANDFMDLYLVSHSEFMVVNSTGMLSLASMFTIPLLMVNATPVSFGVGGFQYTPYDLYIPKKYYSKKKARYLSLREITQIEAECMIWGSKYEQKGIKFIDNTPEEIKDAVEEMLKRLKGEWTDTEKDISSYRRYLVIYEEMKGMAENNENNWIGEPLPYRLATSYLRNNMYLLE